MTRPHIAFSAATTPEAQAAQERLQQLYPSVPEDEADLVVSLGGDGHLLETLHRVGPRGLPVFGMNRGSVGFLLNDFRLEDLDARLAAAHAVTLHRLVMVAHRAEGPPVTASALNEVSLLRQTRQTAKLRLIVDGTERLPELICDGVLLSTPAGSTAYNLSAHGPILPLSANLLALTPISAFRPRRWVGAVLPQSVKVRVEVLEPAKRPVSAVADSTEVRDVLAVDIHQDHSHPMTLLFDPERNLEERILKEQFQAL